MSKDPDSAPNSRLLSKVVKFVTNPTTDWADLDRPPEDQGQDQSIDEASRQALKQIIERKRRNDFVRNREFDMLRKVRQSQLKNAPPEPALAQGGSSWSQSQRGGRDSPQQPLGNQHPPTSVRARVDTLKKIDLIERQMARAWFKKKDNKGAGAAASAASDDDYASTLPPPTASAPPPQAGQPDGAAAAQSVAPQQNDVGFAPTQILERIPPSAGVPTLQPAQSLTPPIEPMAAEAGIEPSFEPEHVLTAETLDPELEEAAIRFANGDIPGAEASLLTLLGNDGTRNDHVETWLALFDLYRASGQQAKFDEAAIDFASCFGRSAPQWSANVNMMPLEQTETPDAAALSPGQDARAHWMCPSSLGPQSVATLNAALARNVSPWRIDWRSLKTIEDAALPALLETLRRWGGAKGEYCLRGAGRLLELLVERSPTDNREVDPQWWNARLALLRLMNEMDEFELVALNYCVTYEVSPPAWEAPVARFVPIDGEADAAAPPSPPPPEAPKAAESIQEAFQPSDFAPSRIFESQEGLIKGELSGIITDEVDKALQPVNATIDHAPARAQIIDINCRLLLRMDFGAAGGLLNWVTMQQALKRQVTLRQVNRLVGAFFGVIGIHEVARVMLRKD